MDFLRFIYTQKPQFIGSAGPFDATSIHYNNCEMVNPGRQEQKLLEEPHYYCIIVYVQEYVRYPERVVAITRYTI